MPRPRVYVCGESGCGRKKERRQLEATLRPVAEVVAVPCQSVCEGPVAGAVLAGRLQWFGRMGTAKARRALVRVTATARRELPGPLVKRRVAKRAGKLRG